jgi:hypothetical protein
MSVHVLPLDAVYKLFGVNGLDKAVLNKQSIINNGLPFSKYAEVGVTLGMLRNMGFSPLELVQNDIKFKHVRLPGNKIDDLRGVGNEAFEYGWTFDELEEATVTYQELRVLGFTMEGIVKLSQFTGLNLAKCPQITFHNWLSFGLQYKHLIAMQANSDVFKSLGWTSKELSETFKVSQDELKHTFRAPSPHPPTLSDGIFERLDDIPAPITVTDGHHVATQPPAQKYHPHGVGPQQQQATTQNSYRMKTLASPQQQHSQHQRQPPAASNFFVGANIKIP